MKLISTAILVIAGVIGLSFAGCTSHKVDYIKAHAEEVFAKQGFEIVALEGWQRGSFDCYGGRVWYVIRRKPDNGIIYHAFIAC